MEHRLEYLLILMTLSFFIYFSAFFITQGREQFETDIEIAEEGATQEQVELGSQVEYDSGGIDLLNIVGAIIGFLGLQTMGVPYPLNVILFFVIATIWTIIVFIIVSITYDFIKALPFT